MHHLVPPNKALQLASHSVIESTPVAVWHRTFSLRARHVRSRAAGPSAGWVIRDLLRKIGISLIALGALGCGSRERSLSDRSAAGSQAGSTSTGHWQMRAPTKDESGSMSCPSGFVLGVGAREEPAGGLSSEWVCVRAK